MNDLLALARKAAASAAEHIRARRPTGLVEVAKTKSSQTDLVTEIDISCEKLIRELILGERPTDGFIGEEGQDLVGPSGVEWVVDPIDGTVNFVHQLPRYAVAIAACRGDETEVAVVVDVANHIEFYASKGQGAWRVDWSADGEPARLRGPAQTQTELMLVATGFNYVREVRQRQALAVAKLLPRVADIRRFGSAALDLTDLAQGRLDAYVEQGLKPWDLIPGGLIATEAGVVLTGPGGRPSERLVVAANAAGINRFETLVEECGF